MVSGYYLSKKRSKRFSDFSWISNNFQPPLTWAEEHGKRYTDGQDVVYSYRTSKPRVGSDTDETQAMLDAAHRDSFRTKADNGHEFELEKHSTGEPKRLNLVGGGEVAIGNFYLLPPTGVDVPPFVGPSSDGDVSYAFEAFPSREVLTAHATELLNRAIPTKPWVGLSQALAELREPLALGRIGKVLSGKGESTVKQFFDPLSRERLLGFTKGTADDWLSFAFGFIPTANDLSQLAVGVIRSKSILDKYLHESGIPIHRKRALFQNRSVFSTGESARVNLQGTPYNILNLDGRSTVIESSTKRSYWEMSSQRSFYFSGAFQYLIPEGSDFVSQMAHWESLANKLLGIRITPSVIYELTPWSWLIDWFFRIGDFISVNEAFMSDSLVMPFGYLTGRTFQNTLVTARIDTGNFRERHYDLVSFYRAERLERIRATPFGFGLDWGGFNPFQLSILAALGLSRR